MCTIPSKVLLVIIQPIYLEKNKIKTLLHQNVGARYIKNLLGGLEQASKAYQPFDRYRHDVSGVKVMTAPGIGQKICTRTLSRVMNIISPPAWVKTIAAISRDASRMHIAMATTVTMHYFMQVYRTSEFSKNTRCSIVFTRYMTVTFPMIGPTFQ
jgi:hypothetical protein